MRPTLAAPVALAACAVLALPAAAGAATTKTVYMGVPPTAGKAMQKLGADANAFFPSAITVRAGQPVTFVPSGFHTVDLPARGQQPLALISPTGKKVAGANDAAGAPFWFNGQDELGFSPELGAPGFGKSYTYTGARRIESGLPLAPKPKPFTVKFAKPGTYTYVCDLHPGMTGKVHVVAPKATAPAAADDAAAVKRQVAAALKTAKRLQATKPPTGTVDVGSAGAGGVESFAIYPAKLTVPVGTTLTFRMSQGSRDLHTATTGPGSPEKQGDYLFGLAKAFEAPVFEPAAAVYPSETPGSPAAALTPQLHGNGFWSSGPMDTSSRTAQIPGSQSVRFAAPGTYEFYCLIHPFMHATVTVQ